MESRCGRTSAVEKEGSCLTRNTTQRVTRCVVTIAQAFVVYRMSRRRKSGVRTLLTKAGKSIWAVSMMCLKRVMRLWLSDWLTIPRLLIELYAENAESTPPPGGSIAGDARDACSVRREQSAKDAPLLPTNPEESEPGVDRYDPSRC